MKVTVPRSGAHVRRRCLEDRRRRSGLFKAKEEQSDE
jgi:hypothetical protein